MGEEVLIESPLEGRHPLRNVALAIAAAVQLSQAGVAVTPAAIARGVRQTRWPGRFQVIREAPDGGEESAEREWVLDVAHNPAGAWALRAALSQFAAEQRLTIVFGVMRDKAVAEIAEILFPLAEHVIATQADNPRSASPQEICEAAARTGVEVLSAPTVAAALARARELAGSDRLVLVTGSTYIVGDALRELA